MSLQIKLEREVRNIIKKNRWLTLSTTSPKGVPQSSVVVYASDGYMIYVLTGKNTVKARNITANHRVGVTIPFYKNYLHRMIGVTPPASISFRARAETRGFGDSEAAIMYRKALNFDLPENMEEDSLWIRLTPGSPATCYGVGIGLLELRDPSKAHKVIKLSNP
jgi:uncharacterized protein YhbP (UPF0306 family)